MKSVTKEARVRVEVLGRRGCRVVLFLCYGSALSFKAYVGALILEAFVKKCTPTNLKVEG